jgi:MFS family permease
VVVRLYPPEQSSLLLAVGALTLVAGLGFACVIVPAQTILQERAPADSRGRIFAVQLMLGSLASVIPLLGVGSLADQVGTPWVFVGLGGGLLGFCWYLLRRPARAGTLAGQVASNSPAP